MYRDVNGVVNLDKVNIDELTRDFLNTYSPDVITKEDIIRDYEDIVIPSKTIELIARKVDLIIKELSYSFRKAISNKDENYTDFLIPYESIILYLMMVLYYDNIFNSQKADELFKTYDDNGNVIFSAKEHIDKYIENIALNSGFDKEDICLMQRTPLDLVDLTNEIARDYNENNAKSFVLKDLILGFLARRDEEVFASVEDIISNLTKDIIPMNNLLRKYDPYDNVELT